MHPPKHVPFSRRVLQNFLEHSSRLRVPCGGILVTTDHTEDKLSVIKRQTTAIYPILKVNSRPTDLITRYGTDSWLILMDACDERLLNIQQSRIQSILAQRHAVDPLTFGLLMSYVQGLSFHPILISDMLDHIEELAQNAKQQLRHIKLVQASTAKEQLDKNTSYQKRQLLVNALEENRITLAYQPIVDARTRDIQYYESLARIVTPDHKLLAAGHFITDCEQLGIIQALDIRVLHLVLGELLANPTLKLSLNVSAVTASNSLWMSILSAYMRAFSHLTGRVVIEVIETSLFCDLEKSIQFMRNLRKLGCLVAIDDFGAGYISLSHLKYELIQIVKIDRQFIKDLSSQSVNLPLIRALRAITVPQGISCIAEGVEDEETLRFLIQEEVPMIQGYYTGKPSLFRR